MASHNHRKYEGERHSNPDATNWIYAIDDTSLPEGHMAAAYPNGVNVLLARIGGKICAVAGKCAHLGCPPIHGKASSPARLTRRMRSGKSPAGISPAGARRTVLERSPLIRLPSCNPSCALFQHRLEGLPGEIARGATRVGCNATRIGGSGRNRVRAWGGLPSSWDLSDVRAKAASFTTPNLNRQPVRLIDPSSHYDESAARLDISSCGRA